MSQEYKRKKYFIDPAFQLNFILKFCLIVIISSLLIGLATFFLSHNATTVAVGNAQVLSTPRINLPELALILLIVAIFSSLIMLFLTLFVSHKISGPIFRIKKEIELVQKGDLTRQFEIRSSDQFQELASSLQEMTQELRQKHLAIGGQCRSVSNFLEEKNLSGSQEDRQKFLQMIKELYELLSYFKV